MSKFTPITFKSSMVTFVIFHHLGIEQKPFEIKCKYFVLVMGRATFFRQEFEVSSFPFPSYFYFAWARGTNLSLNILFNFSLNMKW